MTDTIGANPDDVSELAQGELGWVNWASGGERIFSMIHADDSGMKSTSGVVLS